MTRSNIRFYWFSATHEPAPPSLLAIGIETPQPFPCGAEPAVAFLAAAEDDEQRFLSAMSAELGAQAYVVFVLTAPDPVRAAALLDQADDVCTLQQLAHAALPVDRAA